GSVSGPSALGKQLVPEVVDLGPQLGGIRVAQAAAQQYHHVQAPEDVRPVPEAFTELALDAGAIHGAAGTLAGDHQTEAMHSERVFNGEKQEMPAAGPVTGLVEHTLEVSGSQQTVFAAEAEIRGGIAHRIRPSSAGKASAGQVKQTADFRRSAACGPWRGDGSVQRGHFWWPCGHGSHGCACA